MPTEVAVAVEGDVGRSRDHANGLEQRLDDPTLDRSLHEHVVPGDRAAQVVPPLARQDAGGRR
jgi:hypothetical protein